MNVKELHDYLYGISQKERWEFTARMRLIKPKRKKTYKRNISEPRRLQLEVELKSKVLM